MRDSHCDYADVPCVGPSNAEAMLARAVGTGTYEGMKRLLGMDGGLGLGGGAGFMNASYETGGGGSGGAGGESGARTHVGRGPSGAGAGPGADAGTHYRAKGGRGVTAAGRERVNSWMDFFMRSDRDGGMGLDRDKAMAMVGMMQGESGQNLTPDHEGHDVNGPSGGTAQWHDVDGRPGGRLSALKAFAAKLGRPWTDVAVQQQFWKHEAMTSENRAWKAILAASDGPGALAAGVRHYERPRFPDP